jgi:uncharacterized damage-inducible protein DinB
MIRSLPAEKYNHIEKPYFESCLGKHIRHVLDHYLCFARDFESGVINYEQRQRESRLETDKDYALVVIGEIETFFNSLMGEKVQDHELSVLLCNDVEFPQGEATKSSVRRELQFLQGHSVHHYALIASMLRFYGIDTSREFGVAPSTLVHEETVKDSA